MHMPISLEDALLLANMHYWRAFTRFLQDNAVSVHNYKNYEGSIELFFSEQKRIFEPLSDEAKEEFRKVAFTDEAGLVAWLREYGWDSEKGGRGHCKKNKRYIRTKQN